MANPTKRRTKSSKKQRASHFALDAKTLVKCDVCDAPRRPHYACSSCGNYKKTSIFQKPYEKLTENPVVSGKAVSS